MDSRESAPGSSASIVVCAFASERLEQTSTCVASVLSQRPAPREVLVVVDHNPSLEAQLRLRLSPAVTVVASQGERGLSHARNTALGLCHGDPIVFIDDDAVAGAGWLARLVSAFEDPSVIGAGGHAKPAWQGPRPGWFPDELLWVVGCSYRGLPQEGEVRNPLGCNMAFRAEVFDRAGRFDPGIGRLGTRPLGCEETEFCIRAMRAAPGGRVVLVAGAEIDHAVPPERATVSYLLRRCYYEGISKALVRRLGGTRSLDTERSYVRRTLPAQILASLRTAVTGPARRASLGRIAAILGGLASAAAGYLLGSVLFALRRGGV